MAMQKQRDSYALQIDALQKLIREENLSTEKTEKLIADYLFTERQPLRDEILDLIEGAKPTILERKNSGERILNKILAFVETFIDGFAG